MEIAAATHMGPVELSVSDLGRSLALADAQLQEAQLKHAEG